MLKKTGERLVPENIRSKEEYIQYLRHLFVYEYVRPQLRTDSRVIEIGFGEGYGASYLSESCSHITAIDVEKDSVEHARNKYNSQKCSYQLYDGKKIPFPDNHFNLAISFQVIEHVPDDANFVAEINRVLKSGGQFFITTPNKTYRLKPGQKPWNRYHIREYYPQELESVLKKNFDRVEMRGVSGTDELNQIEYNRIKTGLFLSLMIKLQIRRFIPESFDHAIASMVSRFKGKKTATDANKDFLKAFDMDDFRVITTEVEKSLDLLGVCHKS
jgi:ubiquinone/menaquinone biosynthesis C-methylase UbiE